MGDLPVGHSLLVRSLWMRRPRSTGGSANFVWVCELEKMKRVVLISCGKRKMMMAAPGRDLCTGAMFVKVLRYAEQTCDAAALLSAEHGLVMFDDVIEPYDKTLNDMPIADRRRWAAKVSAYLCRVYRAGRWTYVYLAGVRYIEGLPAGENPMKGLSFGRRLRWLDSQNRLNWIDGLNNWRPSGSKSQS
jgi:hypothetical protein